MSVSHRTNIGMEPAPERGKRTQWKTFLREHLGAICATDFFTVEVLTMTGIVRYFVLFVIDLKTRQVHIAGIAHQVYGKWVDAMPRDSDRLSFGTLRRRERPMVVPDSKARVNPLRPRVENSYRIVPLTLAHSCADRLGLGERERG